MRVQKEKVPVVWAWTYHIGASNEKDKSSILNDSDVVEGGADEANITNFEECQDTVTNVKCHDHTVIFKCIGATRDKTCMATVIEMCQRWQGKTIPVRMRPEPNNVKDSSAIAFDCCVDGKWLCIGYVVPEVLDEVHDVINRQLIIEFDWIKYKSSWAYSCPGFFAGISITKRGCWSDRVVGRSSC